MKEQLAHQLSNRLNGLMAIIAIATFALVPVFFLPLTQDYYETSKWFLLVVSALTILVLWTLEGAISGKFALVLSPVVIGCFGLTLASLGSLLFASQNKIEALLSPFGIGTFAALTIISALSGVAIHKHRNRLQKTYFFIASLLSVTAIYQFFGVGKVMFAQITFLADPLWTPTGTSIGLLSVLCIALPLAGGNFIYRKHHEEDRIFPIVTTILILIALTLSVIRIFPELPKTMLSPLTSWAIALDVLKDWRVGIAGVGVENFILAFSSGRPLAMNATALWNMRPTINGVFLLHLTATMGILGLLASALFLKILWPKGGSLTDKISRIAAVAFFLLLPPSLTVLISFVALLAITNGVEPKTWVFSTTVVNSKITKRWIGMAFVLIAVNVTASVVYLLGRAYSAEHAYYRSLVAAQKNDGQTTYALQVRSVKLNPYISRYRIAFSQTNLAFANAAIQTANDQANELENRDANQQIVSQLLQQAIGQAKQAIALAPTSVFAWENLGRIYRSIIPVAQGTDAWAVAAYQRALQLDPTNPILRVDIAGIYALQKTYDLALEQLRTAITLKPDYANAYYNLANTYRLQGENKKAIEALEKTLTLVLPGGSDELKAKTELDQLINQQPLPTPTPTLAPSITLPEDARP